MMCLGDTPTKYIGTWLELFPSLSTRCCFSSLPILDNFDENVSHPIYPRRFCIKYFHFHCFSVDEFFCTYWMGKYFLMQGDYLIFFAFRTIISFQCDLTCMPPLPIKLFMKAGFLHSNILGYLSCNLILWFICSDVNHVSDTLSVIFAMSNFGLTNWNGLHYFPRVFVF